MPARPSSAKIYRGTPRNLQRLARRLRAGELVAVPTETVYGLAANAFDARACRAIFRAKGRPVHDPLIVHIHSWQQLEEVAHANGPARKLAQAYWPGPLTLVLPKRARVPGVVTAGLDSVAVRMSAHPLFRRLLRLCELPLAAPSANPFGYVSPTTAEHVRASLGRKIHHILNGGPSSIGLESTIVDLRDPKHIQVLRPGAITAQQLRKTLGMPVRDARTKTVKIAPTPVAPGMLPQHYSPRAKVILHRRISLPARGRMPTNTAWLFFRKPPGKQLTDHVFWLDASGNQAKAAQRLYAMLRALDAQGYGVIHTELAPPGARAEAINDRLRRAAAK